MRQKPIIIANWKMHKSCADVERFFDILIPKLSASVSVWIAPSATAIRTAFQRAKSSKILVGAQNIYSESEGPFTGEISAAQASEAGARFVIVGHSERRRLFGETDAQIDLKIDLAMKHDLIPLLCIGETLQERKEAKTQTVLKNQLEGGIVKTRGFFKGVIAYEPIWAIGTGQSATSQMIAEAFAMIRKILIDMLGQERGSQISILYGGSVTKENASSILSIKGVDGVLVGSASLELDSFVAITSGG